MSLERYQVDMPHENYKERIVQYHKLYMLAPFMSNYDDYLGDYGKDDDGMYTPIHNIDLSYTGSALLAIF